MIFGGLLGVWFILCGAGSLLLARLDTSLSPTKIAFCGIFSIAVAYMFATIWWMTFGALSFNLILFFSVLIAFVNAFLLRKADKKTDISIGVMLLSALCIAAMLWVLKSDSRQHFGFDTWDAVVSWNRWATELLNDRFRPYPNPYPVLWPMLWSVIYAAQSAEVWQVLTKNVHLIIIVLASLVCWDLWRRRNAASALVFAGLLLVSTGELFDKFTWGYMDQPVAMLIATGVIAFFLFDDDPEAEKNQKLVWLLPFWFFGVAAVTKQAGWPLIALGLIVAGYDYYRNQVSARTLGLALIGLLGPVIVFAVFFSDYRLAVEGTGDQIQNLMRLSANRTEISSEWQRGLALFFATDSLAGIVRLGSLVVMVIGLFFVRGRHRLILALTAFLAVGGSIGTGICCSYDDRNSGWLLALSIAGVAGVVASISWPLGLERLSAWQRTAPRYDAIKDALFKTRFKVDFRVWSVALPLVLVSAAVIESGSRQYITASENVMLNLGGHEGANALIADINRTGGCRTVYTAHTMVRHNPLLAGFKRRIKDAGDMRWFLHSGQSIDPKCQTWWYFKPGLYRDASQADKELFLRLVEEGQLISIGGYAYRVKPGASW